MHEKPVKSFASLFEELNGVPFQPEHEEECMTLTDEMDHLILMYRDAHFGGDFEVMIQYYENEEHIGIDPEIDYERICYLAQVEEELGQNLAPLFLSAGEAELVATCRRAYVHFRELYETGQDTPSHLLADLILSEEEEPIEIMEAICAQKAAMIPLLIDVVRSDDAYLTLFPGYGYAPYLAALCLGKIGDPIALIPLFEMFHKETSFDDDALLEAFANFGEPAKEFLLKRLQGRPITPDHTHAAFALSVFSGDSHVAQVAIEQLKDPIIYRQPLLATYLLTLCDNLKNPFEKGELQRLSQLPDLPKEVLLQINTMVRDWTVSNSQERSRKDL